MKHVTRFVRRLPVRRKLVLLTLLTSSVALLFSATVFTVYQLSALRGELVRDVSILARVVADQSVRPLQRQDGAALEETLRLLTDEGPIVAATVYTPNGRRVATRGVQPAALTTAAMHQGAGARFDFPYLAFAEPVRVDGSTIGTVLLTSNMQGVYQRLLRDGLIGAGMMLASFAVAYLLTRRVQVEISTPIQDLAERARRVSRDRDYSPYDLEERDDELGELHTAFNQLMVGIRERDDALKRSERHFRSLVENSSDLVFVLSGAHAIRYVSPSAYEFLGYAPGELDGLPWNAIVHDDDQVGMQAVLQESANSPDVPQTIEFRIGLRNGEWCIMEAVVDNRESDKKEPSLLVAARDISERKQAEMALKRAKESVETVERAKSRFLANINNEIRTPMTAILAMTDLLERSELSSDQARYVEIAKTSGDALLHVIDDILELSWLDAGELALDSLEFELDAVVEQVLDLFAQRAHSKGLELCSAIDADVPRRLRGDPGRLRQVLTNLIGNAVKFTDDGQVCLLARLESSNEADAAVVVRFVVEDSGIGIPEGLRARLFDAFVQGDDSDTRRHGGAGIGLAISRSLVSLMQGEIGLDDAQTGGTRFWFTAAFNDGRPANEAPPPLPAPWRGAPALVVDDNVAARDCLTRQLRQLGLRVDEAEDGETALTALRAASATGEGYRLAFIDHGMPGMDGMAVVRASRSDHRLQDLRIALMTSLNDRIGGDASDRAAVDVQIGKPIKQSGLEAAVETLWSSQPAGSYEGPASIAALVPAANARPAAGDTRVLLVEDDDGVRESMSLMLSALGYAVDTANDGAEGLAAATEEDYDLILMDCQMPRMNGYEATMEIRRREAGRRHVPIIGVTGFVLEGERDRGMQAGMDEFLIKPISMATLAAILESGLVSWGAQSSI